MSIDAVISRIRSYRASMEWSVLRLAREAALNESTIRHIDLPGWSPTADTLRKLEAVIPTDFRPSSVPPSPIPNPAANTAHQEFAQTARIARAIEKKADA